MATDVREIEGHHAAPDVSGPPAVPERRLSARESLVEIWSSRHLFRLFGVFAIKRMFYMTVLGPAWILVTVAMDIAGKTFLFGSVLGVRTPNGIPYIVFLLVGMLGWTLFQQTLTFGTRSLQRYRKYATNLHFPLPIVVAAAGAQALLHFAIYLLIALAGIAYYAARGTVYLETGPRLLLAPYGLLLCLLFSWGLAFLLAPLNYRKRDVHLVMKYVLQFWLYVTPVVYPLENLHGIVLVLAKLNPLAPMLEMIKFGLIGGGNIGIEFGAWATGTAVGLFAVGLFALNRFGPRALARPLYDIEDDEDER